MNCNFNEVFLSSHPPFTRYTYIYFFGKSWKSPAQSWYGLYLQSSSFRDGLDQAFSSSLFDLVYTFFWTCHRCWLLYLAFPILSHLCMLPLFWDIIDRWPVPCLILSFLIDWTIARIAYWIHCLIETSIPPWIKMSRQLLEVEGKWVKMFCSALLAPAGHPWLSSRWSLLRRQKSITKTYIIVSNRGINKTSTKRSPNLKIKLKPHPSPEAS